MFSVAGMSVLVTGGSKGIGKGIAAAFVGVTPSRDLDTRNGTGAPQAKVGPAKSIDVQVTGVGGVPSSGVSAVVLNVTVTQATAGSYLTAYDTGAPPEGDVKPELGIPATRPVVSRSTSTVVDLAFGFRRSPPSVNVSLSLSRRWPMASSPRSRATPTC